MKIKEILEKKFTLSFEFFPPKTDEGEKDLFEHLHSLEGVRPDFVSVTYGAGGANRDKTYRIVKRIAQEEKLNVMAHLACVGHTKNEILVQLKEYQKVGIENILALRGDTPAGTDIDPSKGELPHASDLIRLTRKNFNGSFSIGGSVFPNRHPESSNWQLEMDYLKEKVEAGMDFGISQLFFENQSFYQLLDYKEKANVNIPFIPGIMPITNVKQIERFASLCNAPIPGSLAEKLSKAAENPEEVSKLGVDYAIKQCEDLLRQGVRGLHFYTLNKSRAALQIVKGIKSLLSFK
jgi:methylenetetrahydrofolate reductase (NADPH)